MRGIKSVSSSAKYAQFGTVEELLSLGFAHFFVHKLRQVDGKTDAARHSNAPNGALLYTWNASYFLVRQNMIEPVVNYFMALQSEICQALEALDGQAAFSDEQIRPPNGGLSQPRVTADGAHIEKVQFTHSKGAAPSPAATERNPHLAGSASLRPFR